MHNVNTCVLFSVLRNRKDGLVVANVVFPRICSPLYFCINEIAAYHFTCIEWGSMKHVHIYLIHIIFHRLEKLITEMYFNSMDQETFVTGQFAREVMYEMERVSFMTRDELNAILSYLCTE